MPGDRYHGEKNTLSSGHNRQHLNAQIHHDLSLPTSSQFLSFPLVSAVLAVHPSVRLYLSFYVCPCLSFCLFSFFVCGGIRLFVSENVCPQRGGQRLFGWSPSSFPSLSTGGCSTGCICLKASTRSPAATAVRSAGHHRVTCKLHEENCLNAKGSLT